MSEINKQALELTKQACHEELNQQIQKYNLHQYQLIIQYLKKEFCFLLWYSLIGMLLIVFIAQKNISVSIGTLIIYYGLLGALQMFEFMKEDYYQTKDLISISYFNQGRSFLYISCLFTIFEICTFILMCCLLPFSFQNMIMTILCVLIPILVSQMISMYFIQYISNIFTSFVVYIVSYSMVSFFFWWGDFYLTISKQRISIILLILGCLYILTVLYIYKKRRIKCQWN